MSRAITAYINITPRGIPPVISVSQYDTDFTITFNLFSSDGEFTVESGTTAAVSGTKPDRTGYSADCTINTTARTVTVTGAIQMTAAPGRAVFELSLFKNSKRLSTSNFILDVEPAALDADTAISDTVINRFIGLEEQVSGYLDTAITAASNASASASSASASASSASASAASASASAASASASAASAERGKYIASNSNGIMLAKMDGGTTYTPTNAPSTLTNVYEDANGVHVRRGTAVKHTVTTDGDELLALDTNAAASTTDGALYSALSSLAWTDAIVSGMMGMKKLLTKILESFKKSSTSVAINTTYAYASGDTVKLEKCGKVVILSMGALKNLPNGTVNLCTIPAAYRPEKQEDIRTYEPIASGTSRAVRVIVYTNGVVSCYSYGDYTAVSMVNVAIRMVYLTA